MAIVTWNPLSSSLSRWPSFWDEEDFGCLTTNSHNLDVYETANEVVVKANVAGVPADKIDVTFEKGVVFVNAKVEEEDKNDKQEPDQHGVDTEIFPQPAADAAKDFVVAGTVDPARLVLFPRHIVFHYKSQFKKSGY